jgi:hypothetical protein
VNKSIGAIGPLDFSVSRTHRSGNTILFSAIRACTRAYARVRELHHRQYRTFTATRRCCANLAEANSLTRNPSNSFQRTTLVPPLGIEIRDLRGTIRSACYSAGPLVVAIRASRCISRHGTPPTKEQPHERPHACRTDVAGKTHRELDSLWPCCPGADS